MQKITSLISDALSMATSGNQGGGGGQQSNPGYGGGYGGQQSYGGGYGQPGGPYPGGYGPPQPAGYGPPQPGGYGPPQPGGYGPPQPGGYGPPQPGGYGPPQPGGYQPHPGFANQGGYAQQPSYPSNPGYPSTGYSPQNIGFSDAYPPSGNQPGYPPSGNQPSYPPSGNQPGYPPSSNQPNYPPSGNQSTGYPPSGNYQHSQPPSQYPGFNPQAASQFSSSHPPSSSGPAVQQHYQPPPASYSQPLGTPATMSIGNPSVRPFPGFNANSDAETLRKAMKGFGCNNTAVINVLCARTNSQRQQIAIAFKTMYGKDLLKDLRDELHGDFEELVLALMEQPARYDAAQLRKAMQGLGTKESVLIEVMCSRTNAQIAELRTVYRQMYNSDLERDLIGETSGHFKRLLISMCAGGRDESGHVDSLKANQDARALWRAGEARLGTDESTFNAILAAQNFAQLRAVFDEYTKIAKHPIEQAINSEFSGDIRDGLIAVVKCVKNRPAFFAECLHNAMKGMGTRDTDLIRIVVTRAEVDMADIKREFQAMYRKSLEDFIKGDCSGSYKDGLIALVRGN